MKKLFVLLAMSLLFLNCYSQSPIGKKCLVDLVVSWGDPTDPLVPLPRSPLDPPTVYIEDYTLTFEADHPEFILYIKDENQVVVYNTMVGETDTEVVLPSTLSGTYEIDLVTDDYYFWGYITL